MSSEFDKVFTELEAPDYPATCDQCGVEGTNASMEEHVCDESLASRARERGLTEQWDLRQDDHTFEWLIRPDWQDDGTVPFVVYVKGEQAKEVAAQIYTGHNRYATLIEQRKRLLQAAKFALSTPGLIRGRDELQQIVNEVLATIEQETEVKSNTSGEAG